MTIRLKTALLFSWALLSLAAHGQKAGGIEIRGCIANNAAESIAVGDRVLPLTPAGEFLYTAEADRPQVLTVKYRNRPFKIFVAPGERMEISFDAGDIDKSIVFKGVSPETNLFLFRQDKIDEQVGNYFDTSSLEWRSLFSKGEPDFLGQIDALKGLYLKPLDELAANSRNVNPVFLHWARSRTHFIFDWLIPEYPFFHQKYTSRETVLSERTQAYLGAIDLDDPGLLDVEGYAAIGRQLIRMKIREEIRANTAPAKSSRRTLAAAFDVVQRDLKNRAVQDYWLFRFLADDMEANGVKNIAPFMDRFRQVCLTEKLKTDLDSLYREELKKRQGHLIKTYKTIDGFDLDAHIFIPKGIAGGEKRPAQVFFHGGSWSEGKPDWNFGDSPEGFINVCVEYRTYDRHGVLPFEEVSDAKSAIRWLRQNAGDLHVDRGRIIAAGNSAGGHLALCTAMLDILDEPGEDQAVSSKPDALILTSAVYDLAGVWFERIVADRRKIADINPANHIKKGLPPMLVFHGTADSESSPYSTCQKFVDDMKKAGNDIYFYPIENVGHALWMNGRYWEISEKAKAEYFKKLGYISFAPAR